MVESKARKAAFLREAVRVLGLDDVDVCRTSGSKSWLDLTRLARLDLVTVRAVRIDDGLFWQLSGSLLRPMGGCCCSVSASARHVSSRLSFVLIDAVQPC